VHYIYWGKKHNICANWEKAIIAGKIDQLQVKYQFTADSTCGEF